MCAVIQFQMYCCVSNSIKIGWFLSRVSILTRDIDIANLCVRLSVHYVPVSDENGLTCQIFVTVR